MGETLVTYSKPMGSSDTFSNSAQYVHCTGKTDINPVEELGERKGKSNPLLRRRQIIRPQFRRMERKNNRKIYQHFRRIEISCHRSGRQKTTTILENRNMEPQFRRMERKKKQKNLSTFQENRNIKSKRERQKTATILENRNMEPQLR